MQNENIDNQTVNTQTPVESSQTESPAANKSGSFDLKTFIVNNKKVLLIVLGVILVLEVIWASSFIKSSKKVQTTTQMPTATSTISLPKEKIASLSLEPATTSIKIGEQVSLSINVDTNGRSVDGIDTVLTYDPLYLEAVVPVANGDLFNSLLVNDVDAQNGKITLTGSRISLSSNPVTSQGTFATLTFTARKEGKTEVKFIFDPTKTNTSNVTESKTSSNILTTTNDATIQITP